MEHPQKPKSSMRERDGIKEKKGSNAPLLVLGF
jgi:hypothetical protein